MKFSTFWMINFFCSALVYGYRNWFYDNDVKTCRKRFQEEDFRNQEGGNNNSTKKIV